jgi:hypothetical protein
MSSASEGKRFLLTRRGIRASALDPQRAAVPNCQPQRGPASNSLAAAAAICGAAVVRRGKWHTAGGSRIHLRRKLVGETA